MTKRRRQRNSTKKMKGTANAVPEGDSIVDSSSRNDPGLAFSLMPPAFPLIVWSSCAFALLFLIYWSSIEAPFAFDSYIHIENSTAIESLLDAQWFYGRRWLVQLTFAIDHLVYEKTSWGYALTNLMIHGANGMLLFVLIGGSRTLIVKDHRQATSDWWFAAFVSLTWLVHPIQTQCVLYHVQRMESLASFFILCSLVCMRGFIVSDSLKWFCAGAMALFAIASMQCKEIGYVTPLLLVSYYWVFSVSSKQDENLNETRGKRWIGLTIATLATLLFVSVLAYQFFLSNKMGSDEVDSRLMKSWKYFSAQPGVILFYLKLVVFPAGQNVDHVWPYPSSIVTWLIPGIVVSAFFFYGVFQALIRRTAIGFCVLAFFVILGPTSSFLPITDLAVEHRMYLPSACVITFISIGLWRCYEIKQVPSWLPICLSIVVVSTLAVVANQRAATWRTLTDLWQDSTTKQPLNPRAWSNLSVAYATENKLSESIASLELAIELLDRKELAIEYDDIADTSNYLYRLGNLYLINKQPDKALEVFREFLNTDYELAHSFLEIGTELSSSVGYANALPFFERATELAKSDQERSTILLEQSNFAAQRGDQGIKESKTLLVQALKLTPNEWRIHNNLGILTMMQDGDQSVAEAYFLKAVELSNGHSEPTKNLRRLRGK